MKIMPGFDVSNQHHRMIAAPLDWFKLHDKSIEDLVRTYTLVSYIIVALIVLIVLCMFYYYQQKIVSALMKGRIRRGKTIGPPYQKMDSQLEDYPNEIIPSWRFKDLFI
uniref:Uncharacterized protein n=1 Tax=Lepeophtheirus salmonis TaxID=72036 RepID=A0A0K2TUQ9_LEPSM